MNLNSTPHIYNVLFGGWGLEPNGTIQQFCLTTTNCQNPLHTSGLNVNFAPVAFPSWGATISQCYLMYMGPTLWQIAPLTLPLKWTQTLLTYHPTYNNVFWLVVGGWNPSWNPMGQYHNFAYHTTPPNCQTPLHTSGLTVTCAPVVFLSFSWDATICKACTA